MMMHFTCISTRSTRLITRAASQPPGELTTGKFYFWIMSVCFLGMPPSTKCIYRLRQWARRLMETLLHAALTHFGIHISPTGGWRVTQHFLWMERSRLPGTLTVLRNPIHMAPCTRETSDNQETACQENNSSLFNLITATGTYNSTQAGVHRVHRACY